MTQLSIADSLRKAATTRPLNLSAAEVEIVGAFLFYEEWFVTDDSKYRTFVLLVAEALDGGNQPMTEKDLRTVVGYATKLMSMSDIVRMVEKHHGIGVSL